MKQFSQFILWPVFIEFIYFIGFDLIFDLFYVLKVVGSPNASINYNNEYPHNNELPYTALPHIWHWITTTLFPIQLHSCSLLVASAFRTHSDTAFSATWSGTPPRKAISANFSASPNAEERSVPLKWERIPYQDVFLIYVFLYILFDYLRCLGAGATFYIYKHILVSLVFVYTSSQRGQHLFLHAHPYKQTRGPRI